MATLNRTAPAGLRLLAFPPDRRTAVIQTIVDATGLSIGEATAQVDNLPATFRSLLSTDALAEELRDIGATVEYTPHADAIAEQQLRTWRLAETLRALAENRDDEGVRPAAVLLAAEVAEQIANALDSVNLPAPDAPSAPDFGPVAPGVTEQYGALRLAYLALSEFHDAPVGYVITKDDAETLGAIHSQVGRVMAELDELAAELMGGGEGQA